MRPKTKNETLIVVPTYNERGNIEAVYQKIFKATQNCDLLVVDDHSPDGTGEIAEEIARKDSRVWVLHRSGKQGLGTAYVHGFQSALSQGYRYIVAMDADLSHDPANLPRMLSLIGEYDLVIGSRYVREGAMVNWGAGRHFISRLANFSCRGLLGIPQRDCSGGYKCYRADLLEKVGLSRVFSRGYCFQVEILFRALRAGARVVETPIVFVNRHEGKSKLSPGELWEFGWTLLKLRCLAWLGKV